MNATFGVLVQPAWRTCTKGKVTTGQRMASTPVSYQCLPVDDGMYHIDMVGMLKIAPCDIHNVVWNGEGDEKNEGVTTIILKHF